MSKNKGGFVTFCTVHLKIVLQVAKPSLPQIFEYCGKVC